MLTTSRSVRFIMQPLQLRAAVVSISTTTTITTITITGITGEGRCG
jgi:hypothetical protein